MIRLSVLLWLSLVVLVTGNASTDKTGCPVAFGGRCSCGNVSDQHRQMRFLVECLSTGFTNASMLSELPRQTEKLVFRGNYLRELPVNVFGEDDIAPRLEIVDLSENNIVMIHGKTFHHVSNVTRLILNHNEIHISGADHRDRLLTNFDSLQELHLTNAFSSKEEAPTFLVDLQFIFEASYLDELRTLHLEQNKIYSPTNKDLLCSLLELEQLHMSDNWLKDIPLNISCLKKLLFLGVQRNRISRLSGATIRHLDSLPKGGKNLIIDLSDNPFICDCNLKPTLDWMRRTKISLRERYRYTCASGYPRSNTNLTLDALEVLECAPDMNFENPEHYKSANIVLAILLGLVMGLFVVLVYVNRAILKVKLTPVWEYVTRKVRYSSLEEAEEPEVHI